MMLTLFKVWHIIAALQDAGTANIVL